MSAWKYQPPMDQLLPPVEQWFDGELGGAVLAAQRRLLDAALRDCFGYHLLQLSVSGSAVLYDGNRVQRKLRAGPLATQTRPWLRCHFHELPLASDSIDVVILHHVLEFHPDPHLLLREIQRVTVPNGRLFLLGFNPWSLLALRARAEHWRGRSIWHNHWLRAGRVSDWLRLLGFEVDRVRYGYHRPPLSRPRRLLRIDDQAESGWQHSVPGGAFYLLSAVRQVAAATPLKPRWKPAEALGNLSVVKPVAGASREAPSHRSRAAE